MRVSGEYLYLEFHERNCLHWENISQNERDKWERVASSFSDEYCFEIDELRFQNKNLRLSLKETELELRYLEEEYKEFQRKVK